MVVEASATPWYADIINLLVSNEIPPDYNHHQKKRFLSGARRYYWEEPILYRQCADSIIRRCVPDDEIPSILRHCHSLECGGHFAHNRTAAKVLQSGFFWPTLFRECRRFVETCDRCQRTGNISNRNEMPLKNILEIESFDVWGIDFMGPFPSS